MGPITQRESSRSRPTFLMCRPTHYQIRYEINPWMSLKHPAGRAAALQQWKDLHGILTGPLKLKVRLIRAAPEVPDLVFTANAGLVFKDLFVRSNFRHPQRRKEEPIFERYFARRNFQVITLPRALNFEGEGDALWMGETLFLGYRFRSDARTHDHLAGLLQRRVLPLELVDRRFYHLDTCFCPVDDRTLLWYPGAFDDYGRKVIEGHAADPIPVTEEDALRFCCNAVVVGKTLVLQKGISRGLRDAMTRRGLRCLEVDLSEFLKAGGSAKCLVLTLPR